MGFWHSQYIPWYRIVPHGGVVTTGRQAFHDPATIADERWLDGRIILVLPGNIVGITYLKTFFMSKTRRPFFFP